MPIYEFSCQSCGHFFESIMRNSDSNASCPTCKSQEVKKVFSTFAAHSGSNDDASCQTPTCGYDTGACGSGMCGSN